jgi:hypothetical protein
MLGAGGGVFSISSRSLVELLLDILLRDRSDLKNDEPLLFFVSGGDWDLASDLGSIQTEVSLLKGDGSSRKVGDSYSFLSMLGDG